MRQINSASMMVYGFVGNSRINVAPLGLCDINIPLSLDVWIDLSANVWLFQMWLIFLFL